MDQTIRKVMEFNLKNAIIIIDEGHNIAAEAESCQTKQFDNKDIIRIYSELNMLEANINYFKSSRIELLKFFKSTPDDVRNVKSQLNLIKDFIKAPQTFVSEKFNLDVNNLENELKKSNQTQNVFHEVSLIKVFPQIDLLSLSIDRIVTDSLLIMKEIKKVQPVVGEQKELPEEEMPSEKEKFSFPIKL